MANRQKALMWGMFVIILILAAIVVYAFVVGPAVTGYTTDRQVEGYQIALSNIVQQVQQNGFVQIPVGNQTLYLAPFNPQQAQQEPLQ